MLQDKFCSAEEVASQIRNGEVLGVSGFTLSGYPKAIPRALAARAEKLHEAGEAFQITLFSGASTGDSCDGALVRAQAISVRAPYQSNANLRAAANANQIVYLDEHLGLMGVRVREGSFPTPTTAIIEVSHIEEDGRVYLSTSGGNSKAYIERADRIFLEWNERYGESFKGLHDVFLPDLTPGSEPIPIRFPGDRADADFIKIPLHKIAGIVKTNAFDEVHDFTEPDETARTIAGNILEFLEYERKKGKLPENLSYQSGVGNVANAVLAAMARDDKLKQINIFTEVIQEACIPLLERGKLGVASGTALTLSPSAQLKFLKNIKDWKKHFVLRQQEVSNSAEVIRRVGVISMNTALECDIFGNVNSSHVCGSGIMNGIGGAADFARQARLGIFMTPSVAKNGNISTIVPLVSHVDHTEHDTMIFVTEQGIADLRGLSAEQKARRIISNCVHPDYREQLTEILERGLSRETSKHIPLDLSHAFSMHERFLETGNMREL